MKIGSFAVILDTSGRVLLCRRADNRQWNLPGGGVENGETPWDAVAREVTEETGMTVAMRALAGIYWIPHENLGVFSFVCSLADGEPSLSAEVVEIGWFRHDALPNDTLARHRERIIDVVSFAGTLLMKVQD